MDTHFARTGGQLVSTDATPPFQPNVVKQSVAMRCKPWNASPDDSFKQEYNHRKHMFYQSNTTDSHQEHREWLTLGQKAHGARGVGRPRGPVVRQWVRAQPRRPHAADGALLAQGDERLGAASSSPRPFTPSNARRLHGQADGHVQEDVLGIRGSSEDAEEPPRHRLRPLASNSPPPTFHSGTAPRCVPSPPSSVSYVSTRYTRMWLHHSRAGYILPSRGRARAAVVVEDRVVRGAGARRRSRWGRRRRASSR